MTRRRPKRGKFTPAKGVPLLGGLAGTAAGFLPGATRRIRIDTSDHVVSRTLEPIVLSHLKQRNACQGRCRVRFYSSAGWGCESCGSRVNASDIFVESCSPVVERHSIEISAAVTHRLSPGSAGFTWETHIRQMQAATALQIAENAAALDQLEQNIAGVWEARDLSDDEREDLELEVAAGVSRPDADRPRWVRLADFWWVDSWSDRAADFVRIAIALSVLLHILAFLVFA